MFFFVGLSRKLCESWRAEWDGWDGLDGSGFSTSIWLWMRLNGSHVYPYTNYPVLGNQCAHDAFRKRRTRPWLEKAKPGRPVFCHSQWCFHSFDGYKWRGKGDMQPKRPELKVNNRFNSKEVKQKREIHGNPTIFKLKEMVYKSCSFTV